MRLAGRSEHTHLFQNQYLRRNVNDHVHYYFLFPADEEGFGDPPRPQCYLHNVPHHGGKVASLFQSVVAVCLRMHIF